MFEHYIWDFDGTLYDTYPVMLDAFVLTLADYDIQADRREIYQILKNQSSATIAEKYQLDFAEFSARFKRYENQDTRIPVSYTGTKEMLESVLATGSKNYIMTHRTVASTKELLEREGMLHLFEEIVGTENNFARKPAPDAINYLTQTYQMPVEKTVMIGDRPLDIDAGKNAQVKTIFYDLEQLISDVQADYTVCSVAEMQEIIEK
ncbi:HAD-IA family hydrolase [Enterococcus saccharolyticus]|uniref:HAD-IA family hydrolase n=2 Tax=Enterococcus TaxID=1350 RepID=UPI001E65B00D|nr:HAD-IA family hydrolase [Enterococcus saccharolyticus]MCD5000890.1 HAD-IA family hydrolase [Enterococcus saccharolyticus]